MKRILAVLFIVIGLACIAGGFLLPKEEETVPKKEEKKGEVLTPPEKKEEPAVDPSEQEEGTKEEESQDEESTDEESEYVDDSCDTKGNYRTLEDENAIYGEGIKENFKYGFDSSGWGGWYSTQFLTPGTYTSKNLDEYILSYYLSDEVKKYTKELKKCTGKNKEYVYNSADYVSESDMKKAFEKVFGKGTYHTFYYTDYQCYDLKYNSKTKRYEGVCTEDGTCGDGYHEYDYSTKLISKTKSGENTIYVERVYVLIIGTNKICQTYELTYTIRTADNVFISVTSKKV